MCVTGSGWAVKLELNLCLYRNGPIVKLLYFLTSAFVKQSLNTQRVDKNWVLGLAAFCEHLRQHLGPIFSTVLWSDSSRGACSFFFESVMHSLSNTPYMCPSTWAGRAPPSEVESVLSAALLRRHMLCEWQWWASPGVMVSTPFTDKPAGNHPLSHYYQRRRKERSSFLSFLSSSPQTLLSIPFSLLRFFSFFIASRGFPSRVLLLSSILYFAHSIINWLHEQYTK